MKKGRSMRPQYPLLNTRFLLFKFLSMLLEKVVIRPNIGQFCPFLHPRGITVQIIDSRRLHGEQKRRMGGEHQLASEKSHRLLQEMCQLLLSFGGQTVLRSRTFFTLLSRA